MNNKIFVQLEPKKIQLYIPIKSTEGTKYVQYCLRHFQKGYIDGGTYQNQNLWRLYELHVYEKEKSDGFRQVFPYAIVNGGEWECALQIAQTPDFHGGFHGYEHYTDVKAYADDKPIDCQEYKQIWVDKFEFCQNSEIYRQGTENEVLAIHIKRYCFMDGSLYLHQEILWQQSVKVLHAYMAMLPIRRTSDDTEDGQIITDSVKINSSDEIYDVAKIGHQTSISFAEKQMQNVTHAEIWSDVSKIKAEMYVSGNLLADNSFFVQNTREYNKFYFSYTGHKSGHLTYVGEKWKLDSQYKVYMF